MTERERRERRTADAIVRQIQQDIHSIQEKYNSEDDREKPPQRVVIDAGSELPRAIAEYYTSENQKRKKNALRENIRLGAEIVALVAAIIAATFTAKMLRQVTRQADAAHGQLQTMQGQMRLDQRAWIVVKYGTIQLNEGSPLITPIIVENIGKTVARKISGKISVYIVRKGQDPDLSYEPGHTHYEFGPTGIFIPNAPDTMNWVAIRDGQRIVPTPPMHRAVLAGDSLITQHGRIEYYDIFGDYHWLTFCQQTGGGIPRASGSDKCAAYNDADDSERNKK